jgi:hypothetical protein
MARVADSALRNLRDHRAISPEHCPHHSLVRVKELSHLFRLHPERCAFDLHPSPVLCAPAADDASYTDQAFPAGHEYLGRRAVHHKGEPGDDCVDRKIDLIDLALGLVKNFVRFQLDHLKVREHLLLRFGRQGRKQKVLLQNI